MGSNVNKVSTFTDLANLEAKKLQQLETVLTSILALPIARDTYAQIITVIPTDNPLWDSKYDGYLA